MTQANMQNKEVEWIGPDPVDNLYAYEQIPSRFTTSHAMDVASGEAGFRLVRRTLSAPLHKDYDLLERPSEWPRQFETANWALFHAQLRGQRIAGAIVARDTPGVDMLEGRRDLAVLWDIRVAPAFQGRGIGAGLFRAAARSAETLGCTELKVETQDVNVNACAFYAAMGCRLEQSTPGAYPELPGESRFIWRKHLA